MSSSGADPGDTSGGLMVAFPLLRTISSKPSRPTLESPGNGASLLNPPFDASPGATHGAKGRIDSATDKSNADARKLHRYRKGGVFGGAPQSAPPSVSFENGR